MFLRARIPSDSSFNVTALNKSKIQNEKEVSCTKLVSHTEFCHEVLVYLSKVRIVKSQKGKYIEL